MQYVFLSLGSNKGRRSKLLDDAVQRLGVSVMVVKRSPVIETAPWGFSAQPKFLNMALLAKTGMSSGELLGYIGAVEKSLGRERGGNKWGSRVVDIDIITYGSCLIKTDDLTVPHPLFHKRMFVLKPMADIAPEYVVPGFYDSIVELKESLNEIN